MNLYDQPTGQGTNRQDTNLEGLVRPKNPNQGSEPTYKIDLL
jgi:hypothetical protein